MIGTQIVVSNPLVIYFELLFFTLLAFSLYDIKRRRVSNVALVFFAPFALISIYLLSQYRSIGECAIYAVGGFLAGGLILLAAAIVTKGGIGGGDIKLCALLGIIVGPFGILLILFFATLLAIAAGGIKHFLFRTEVDKFAFVPFLSVGTAAFILLNLFW